MDLVPVLAMVPFPPSYASIPAGWIAFQYGYAGAYHSEGCNPAASIPEHVVADGPRQHMPLSGTTIFHSADGLHPPTPSCRLPEGISCARHHRCTFPTRLAPR